MPRGRKKGSKAAPKKHVSRAPTPSVTATQPDVLPASEALKGSVVNTVAPLDAS